MTREQKVLEFIQKIDELEKQYNLEIVPESHRSDIFVSDKETNKTYHWNGEEV